MPIEQVENRIQATKGKVKAVAGKVVGNNALEQAGITRTNAGKNQIVAGHAKKYAKSPSTPKDQEAPVIVRRDHQIVSDLWEGSLTVYSF